MKKAAAIDDELTGNHSGPSTVPYELTADQLRFKLQLGVQFDSTRELENEEQFFGQERALASLDLGLGVSASGYNVFVSGYPLAFDKTIEWVAWRRVFPYSIIPTSDFQPRSHAFNLWRSRRPPGSGQRVVCGGSCPWLPVGSYL